MTGLRLVGPGGRDLLVVRVADDLFWVPRWIALNRPSGTLPSASFWVGYDLEIEVNPEGAVMRLLFRPLRRELCEQPEQAGRPSPEGPVMLLGEPTIGGT